MIRLIVLCSVILIYFSSCGCSEEYISYYDIPVHTRSAFVYQKGQNYKFKIKDSLSTYEVDMVVEDAYYKMQEKLAYTGIYDCGIYDTYYKEIYYAKLYDSNTNDSLEISIYDYDDYNVPENQHFYYFILYNGKRITEQSSFWIERSLETRTKSINGIQYFDVYTNKAFQHSTDSLNEFTFNYSKGLLEVILDNFSLTLLSQ